MLALGLVVVVRIWPLERIARFSNLMLSMRVVLWTVRVAAVIAAWSKSVPRVKVE